MIKVAIIIVNWNGKKFLPTCLSSLRGQTYKLFKVIFVDNGSTDGSVEFVRKNFPEIMIIENKRNLGFAEGNNIGIRQAFKNKNIKYIVALNNDTKLDENWLKELIISVESSGPKFGSFQGKILNFKNV